MPARESTHVPQFSKRLLDELQNLDKSLIDACKEILNQNQDGGSIDEVLVLLMNHGCNLFSTIMYLLATGRFSLKTAKATLHASDAWGAEIRAHDQIIRESLDPFHDDENASEES